MIIRQPLKSEFELLHDFAPKDWNFDLTAFLSFHFGYPYFYPIVAELNNRIVGFGNGILNGSTGWIGNIIISSDYRRQGIGHAVTNHLVEYFRNKGCNSQLLVASDMGRNIYGKIGFKPSSTYQFFRIDQEYKCLDQSLNLRRITELDIPKIKEFDKLISGEERFPFMERFLPTGWIYSNEGSNSIKGMYLPELGGGLIFALDAETGLELMKTRLRQGKTNAVVPSANKAAVEFLINNGFQKYMELPRMVIGDEVNWKPEFVFNRATGYCG